MGKEPTEALDRTSEPLVVSGVAPGDSGLLEDVKSLWHDLRGLVHDQLTLAALETRLAVNSLVTKIAAGVMVAALLVSAWLGLMGVAVLWLISIGVMASIARILSKAFPSAAMGPSARSGISGPASAPRYRSAAA